MFEDKTQELIIKEMMENVPSDVDKSEGSLVYSAISPCALKLAEAYAQLDNYYDMVFSDTADGDYLDRAVYDFGYTRHPSVCATRKLVSTGTIEIGTRFSINDATYKVTEPVSGDGYVYLSVCEQSGLIGNAYSGEITPIDYIGEVTAQLTDIVIAGEEEETDDNFRKRFKSGVSKPSTSGNAADYKKWATSVDGVGDAKIKPLWNGNGTVKITVINSSYGVTETLPKKVKTYVDSARPIGPTITVTSPDVIQINITATITADVSKTISEITSKFNTSVSNYLTELIKSFYSTSDESYSVSYAVIGSLLLSVTGVTDYNNLMINTGTSNISVSAGQIPIVGTITLTEA